MTTVSKNPTILQLLKEIAVKKKDLSADEVLKSIRQLQSTCRLEPSHMAMLRAIYFGHRGFYYKSSPESRGGYYCDFLSSGEEYDVAIITPTFNSAKYLHETIVSIISQDDETKIRYHIQDGGSTDSTIETILDWADTICRYHPNIHFSFQLTPDDGMYDAITKSLVHLQDEVRPDTWMGWINSDDKLSPNASKVLINISKKFKNDVNFVASKKSVCDSRKSLFSQLLPISNTTVKQGLLDGEHLPHLQQEGTFFKYKCLEKLDLTRFSKLKLAGDYYLWVQLASNYAVFQVNFCLGTFFSRPELNQLSSNITEYTKEVNSILPRSIRKKDMQEIVRSGPLTGFILEVSDATLEPSLIKRKFLIHSNKAFSFIDTNHQCDSHSPSIANPPQINLLNTASLNAYSRFMPYINIPSNSLTLKKRFGIAVFTHTRYEHLELILASIKAQGFLPEVNIFIDGHQNKGSLKQMTDKCKNVAKGSGINNSLIFKRNSLLGFRKAILHGLVHMTNNYESFLVLEDDCYPLKDGINTIKSDLESISNNPSVFSVYGHRFEMESENSGYCTRFQGWGWATTAAKMAPVLKELIYLYSLDERDFLEFIQYSMSNEIRNRLNVTPPRNPTDCLDCLFAWDETISLLCALKGLVHKPTQKTSIINFGIDIGESDFSDSDRFRLPPYNMKSISDIRKLHNSSS